MSAAGAAAGEERRQGRVYFAGLCCGSRAEDSHCIARLLAPSLAHSL